jgi:hypothetical protein
MCDVTVRCTCGVYLHATELSPAQVVDIAKTWVGHEHTEEPE